MCTMLIPFNKLGSVRVDELLMESLAGGFYNWIDITIDGHGKYCLNNNVDI